MDLPLMEQGCWENLICCLRQHRFHEQNSSACKSSWERIDVQWFLLCRYGSGNPGTKQASNRSQILSWVLDATEPELAELYRQLFGRQPLPW